MASRVMMPKKISTMFSHDPLVGVKCIVIRGLRASQACTRHTCATLRADLDVHQRVAMQILRHTQIAVTMEIYTEASSPATRAALKRLGDSLR